MILPAVVGALAVGAPAHATTTPQLVTTELVSAAADGSAADSNADPYGFKANHASSDDGRFIVFDSLATNLLDTPQTTRGVYLRDRETSTTVRVDTTADGQAANGNSFMGSISADGNKILFKSKATNLSPIAVDGQRYHAFLKDRVTGAVELVSLSNEGMTWRFGVRNRN